MPLGVVPNGDGGIVFECRERSPVESTESSDDAQIEYLRFAKSRLVDRLDGITGAIPSAINVWSIQSRATAS